MKETDKTSKDALEAAKSGDVKKAEEILQSLSTVDPRPIFYWLAKAEVCRTNGDKEAHANCLRAFEGSLFGRLFALLGYTKPGKHSADDLTKNTPEQVTNAKKAALSAWQAQNYDEAIRLLQKAIDLEIADLKKLGDDIFA